VASVIAYSPTAANFNTKAQLQDNSGNGINSIDNQLLTTEQGAPNIGYGQVSVASTATSIVSARTARRGVIITNSGTTDVFIGDASVTTSTGLLLPGTKGAFVVIPANVQIYGIVASSTQTVSFLEVYN